MLIPKFEAGSIVEGKKTVLFVGKVRCCRGIAFPLPVVISFDAELNDEEERADVWCGGWSLGEFEVADSPFGCGWLGSVISREPTAKGCDGVVTFDGVEEG